MEIENKIIEILLMVPEEDWLHQKIKLNGFIFSLQREDENTFIEVYDDSTKITVLMDSRINDLYDRISTLRDRLYKKARERQLTLIYDKISKSRISDELPSF